MNKTKGKAPRIRVQVKHREQKVTIKEVRELEAVLRKEGDIGLFVSRTGFTADAEREIRSSTKHIETMDLDRLVSLWQQHYEKLSETGKALLPLVKVYFRLCSWRVIPSAVVEITNWFGSGLGWSLRGVPAPRESHQDVSSSGIP